MRVLVLGVFIAMCWVGVITYAVANTPPPPKKPCLPCLEADLLKMERELKAERERLKRELGAIDKRIAEVARVRVKEVEDKFKLTMTISQEILNGPYNNLGVSIPVGPLTLNTGFWWDVGDFTRNADVLDRGFYVTFDYSRQWAVF